MDIMKTKKAVIVCLAVIMLFIPSYIAIYLYASAQTAPVKESSVYAIDLNAPDGNTFSFVSGEGDDDEMINFFLDINKNAKSIVSLPEDLGDQPYYTAVYYSYDLETQYKYYFSKTKPSNSYMEDNDGKAYRIEATSTIEFLDGEYSGALYPGGSGTPSLTVAGTEIEPSVMNWHYYTYSSARHDVKTETPQTKQTLDVSFMEIPSSFSVYPDSASITISSGANVIYSGTLVSFSENGYLLDYLKKGALLSAVINAEWEDNLSLGYGGDAEYRFDLNCAYDPPPMFWIGEKSIEMDEFVILSGLNITNPANIIFTSEPEIGYEPKFYKDGDYVRAVVPISASLANEPGKYKFTIEYDDEKTVIELDVKESTIEKKTRKYNYSGDLKTSARTADNLADFADFVVSTESSASPLFNGVFVFNSLSGTRARFGDTINNGTEAQKFISGGLACVAYYNDTITAVNSGKVAAVGTTKYGGKTVVIDHGLGIRSVYYCVKNVSVSVGDIVTTGSAVGTGASTSGYTDGLTTYIELWVDNIPVSYFPLLESGRTSMITFGERPTHR